MLITTYFGIIQEVSVSLKSLDFMRANVLVSCYRRREAILKTYKVRIVMVM